MGDLSILFTHQRIQSVTLRITIASSQQTFQRKLLFLVTYVHQNDCLAFDSSLNREDDGYPFSLNREDDGYPYARVANSHKWFAYGIRKLLFLLSSCTSWQKK